MPRVICTHVICRGTECRTIFREDSDRDDFLKRLETILSATQTPCYAWTDSWDILYSSCQAYFISA